MSAFLHSVDVFLGKLGFVCSDAFDDQVYVSYWQRPVAWADNFFEFVAMLEQSRTRERSEVSARIGIASQLLTDVENAADLWQCGTGALDPRSLPWRFPMPLIQVALHWLSRNKGSELKTGWAIRGSGSESDAAGFFASFEQYAVPFFQSVGRLDDLAELVLHMEEYPSNLPSTGFTSPDPINYLSIALFHAGQPERSFRLLDASLDEQYPRSIWKIIARDPAYREVLRCRVKKVKSFLVGISASPTMSPNTGTG